MTASTSKKVIVYRYEREPVSGYVRPQSYAGPAGIEIVTPSGAAITFPFEQVKMVCFVRDFEGGSPEAERHFFANRPKTEGLWVRMRFREGEEMDALLANNLLQLEPYGFTVSPPDPASNSQRIFIPRASLTEIKVAGVVGSPVKPPSRKKPKAPGDDSQLSMFE